jgi:hypothetical protein
VRITRSTESEQMKKIFLLTPIVICIIFYYLNQEEEIVVKKQPEPIRTTSQKSSLQDSVIVIESMPQGFPVIKSPEVPHYEVPKEVTFLLTRLTHTIPYTDDLKDVQNLASSQLSENERLDLSLKLTNFLHQIDPISGRTKWEEFISVTEYDEHMIRLLLFIEKNQPKEEVSVQSNPQ